jgi:hypothetical protein
MSRAMRLLLPPEFSAASAAGDDMILFPRTSGGHGRDR